MAQFKTSNSTYNGLKTFLGKSERKIIAHNTLVFCQDDTIKVQYHDSVIAILTENKVELSNGGWMTNTTKDRLNWVLSPYQKGIYQKDHIWYVWDYGQRVGMGVFPGIAVYYPSTDTFEGLTQKDDRKGIHNQIKKYATAYVNALINGEVESPSSGDCWDCLMFSKSRVSWSHIESHIAESYYVPSLLVRAIEYKDVSIMAKGLLHQIWYEDNPEDNSKLFDVIKDQYQKSLIAYMLHCYDHK